MSTGNLLSEAATHSNQAAEDGLQGAATGRTSANTKPLLSSRRKPGWVGSPPSGSSPGGLGCHPNLKEQENKPHVGPPVTRPSPLLWVRPTIPSRPVPDFYNSGGGGRCSKVLPGPLPPCSHKSPLFPPPQPPRRPCGMCSDLGPPAIS